MSAARKSLVIVPTKGRAATISERIIENARLSSVSDFVLAVDFDDRGDYSWAESNSIKISRGPSLGMNFALNRVAMERADDYEYLSFMGDDSAVKTPGWDEILIKGLEKKGFGVAYGDDLLSDGKLPTFVIISSDIIRSLGYMAPPVLKHMFLDNFWLHLGTKLEACYFDKNVIVEHLHPSAGKAVLDDTYRATNRHIVNLRDKARYYLYLVIAFPVALKILRKDLAGRR